MREQYQFEHPATGCTKCPVLTAERQHVVWGRGPAPADIFMVGEAPGFNEDREGIPFIGRAGQELSKMLTEAGFTLNSSHIGNRVMCRPPNNRDPEPDEIENCLPWLIQHTREVEPKAVVLFGRAAISWFFDQTTVQDTEGLMYQTFCAACGGQGGRHEERYALNGRWGPDVQDAHQERKLLIAAIYHPASILPNRYPEFRPRIIHQLQRVKQELLLLKGGTP